MQWQWLTYKGGFAFSESHTQHGKHMSLANRKETNALHPLSPDGEGPDVEVVSTLHVSAAHCHRAVGFLIPFLLRPVLVTLFLDRTKHNYKGHIQENEDRSAMKLISLSFPAYFLPFVHRQVQVICLYRNGDGMHAAASCLSQNLLRAHRTKTQN